MFLSKCFKEHFSEIINELHHSEELSNLFYYLPSIKDRKGKIHQFCDKVSLNPINFSLDSLNNFSPKSEVTFQPQLLNSNDLKKRGPQIELLYKFFRQLAETSNTIFFRNANHLLAASKKKRDNVSITWVGPSKQRYNESKFKLTY